MAKKRVRQQRIALVLFALGAGLLAWGISMSQSFSSSVSRVVSGSPTNEALVVLALGGMNLVAGLVLWFKK